MPDDRGDSYFVVWEVKTEGVILPEERLPTGPTILVGLQHVVAMFGATVLAPLLMGFDPNVAIFFSGIATLIFFVVTGGRVPSYLGSSFAFIGPVLVATGAAVAAGPNPQIGLALGGIIAAGAVYAVIGLIVIMAGHGWVEKLMPPVVTGGIVAAIGLVLAPIAIQSASGIGQGSPDGTAFARWIALITVVAVGLCAVYAPGPRAAHPDPDRRDRRLRGLLDRRQYGLRRRRSISQKSARPPGSACRISPRRCSIQRQWC
jgi:putative pyrimidine permease RutG